MKKTKTDKDSETIPTCPSCNEEIKQIIHKKLAKEISSATNRKMYFCQNCKKVFGTRQSTLVN